MVLGVVGSSPIEVPINSGVLPNYGETLFICSNSNKKYNMNFPENLRYTAEHEWIKTDGNQAWVGITAFAQSELGDIVFVDVNTVGQTVAKDGVFGSVEAVKTVSDLFLPVAGKILEVNPALTNAPELLNSDPYGDGWVVKIEMENAADVDSLMDATAYKAAIGV